MSDIYVKIGGDPRPVPPLNMTKFRVAGKLMSRLSVHLSDAMLAVAEYSQHYGQINKVPVTRDRAERWGFTEADFKDRPFIEMPAPPTDMEQFAVGAARVYDAAEDDVARLCALVLADKDELKKARRAGNVDGFLLDQGEEVLEKASPEEFIDLLATAMSMARERFDGKDLVGKLRRAWNPDSESVSTPGSGTGDSGQPTEHPASGRMPMPGSVQQAPTSGETPTNDESSTGSQGSTTGQPTTSSTTSRSETSSVTPA